MEQVAARQRAGLEKRRLRREMLAGPIGHLSGVGGLAKREHPDLVNRFRHKPSGASYVAHRTAARSMQAEAEAHTEALTKYGLSEAMLEAFGQLLDRFDAAVKLGSDGRARSLGFARDDSGDYCTWSGKRRSCGPLPCAVTSHHPSEG
jgi:hypothetical protein